MNETLHYAVAVSEDGAHGELVSLLSAFVQATSLLSINATRIVPLLVARGMINRMKETQPVASC